MCARNVGDGILVWVVDEHVIVIAAKHVDVCRDVFTTRLRRFLASAYEARVGLVGRLPIGKISWDIADSIVAICARCVSTETPPVVSDGLKALGVVIIAVAVLR